VGINEGWGWDRDDWQQEGRLGILEQKLPVEKARWSAWQRFRDRARWDLEHCQRYVAKREYERKHRGDLPGELIDIPDLLGRLTPVELQVIQMRIWEELEFREIGQRLDTCGKTAWRWYQAALAKMRKSCP